MITFRRKYLDEFLESVKAEFKGVVLDIGGERVDNRSSFEAPVEQCEKWTIINIDPRAEPDIEASADNIPLDDAVADNGVMTELLEHVPTPEAVLSEAARLMKSGATAFITMPFLYQVHADPQDFSRWTDEMMRMKVEAAGLRVESLEPMGGVFAVIYDLLRAHIYRTSKDGTLRFKIKIKFINILSALFKVLDKNKASASYMTTGWAVVAKKP